MNTNENGFELMECLVTMDKIRKAIACRDQAVNFSPEELASANSDFFHYVAGIMEDFLG